MPKPSSPTWLQGRHIEVRCSQAGISLRVPKEVKVLPMVSLAPASKPPKQKRSYAFAVPTTLQLSKVAMSRLRQRAEAIGVDEAELVAKLLEVIAQDDLFDAVLDNDKGAANEHKRHSDRTGQGFRSGHAPRTDGRRGD